VAVSLAVGRARRGGEGEGEGQGFKLFYKVGECSSKGPRTLGKHSLYVLALLLPLHRDKFFHQTNIFYKPKSTTIIF
jgi:hypothetical protein